MSFHRLSITEFDKNDKERPNDSDRPTCPEAETTDVAWSVCLSLCACLCVHYSVLKWSKYYFYMDSQRFKIPCFRRGPGIPHGKGHFGSHSYLGIPKLACGRYSRPYSLGGNSGVAFGCQSTLVT